MDVLVGLLGGIRPVTGFYLLGIVGCTIARNIGLLETIPNDFKQIVQRGQYHLIPLSFFHIGSHFNIGIIIELGLNLSHCERVIGNSKRYMWHMVVLSAMTSLICYYYEIRNTVFMVEILKCNMTFYVSKIEGAHDREMYFGLFRTPLSIIMWNQYALWILSNGHGIVMWLLGIVPGYILYYVAVVVSRIYNTDIGRPLDEWLAPRGG